MKILAAVWLVMLAAGAALAQDDAKTAAAERDMALLYHGLLGKLAGEARVHLEADQVRWFANRRGCDAVPVLRNDCLEFRAGERAAKLKLFADGPYPFVSEQAIVRSGKTKDRSYAIDASYPQFDGSTADFSAVNRHFAKEAETIAGDIASSSFDATYDQDFVLYRPGANVISVVTRSEVWQGTLSIALAGTLVDLRTGKIIPPEDVFRTGDGWRARLGELVVADVVREFMAAGRGAAPAGLASMVTELSPEDYLFEDEKLVLSLDAVARSLGMKAYTVDIAYALLQPWLRADGPLGGR